MSGVIGTGLACLELKNVAGTIEPSMFYLAIGCEATPADNTIIWYVQRTTGAAGAGTTVTPQNLGPSTVASLCTTCLETLTTNPTLTANAMMWRLGLNQRAAHSLVFDPEGCPTIPATANAGLALMPTHASATPVCSATMYFRE